MNCTLEFCTRNQNRKSTQHSQRGKKNSWIAEKKVEKKKKNPLLALLSWQTIHCCQWRKNYSAIKSRRLFALFVRSPLDRFVKDFSCLIYFLLFIRRFIFSHLKILRLSIIIRFILYFFFHFAHGNLNDFSGVIYSFLCRRLIVIYIVFLWYFFVIHVITLRWTES